MTEVISHILSYSFSSYAENGTKKGDFKANSNVIC